MSKTNRRKTFDEALDEAMGEQAAHDAAAVSMTPRQRLDAALDDQLHEQACDEARRNGEPAPLRPSEIADLQKEREQLRRDRDFLMQYAGMDDDSLAEERRLQSEASAPDATNTTPKTEKN